MVFPSDGASAGPDQVSPPIGVRGAARFFEDSFFGDFKNSSHTCADRALLFLVRTQTAASPRAYGTGMCSCDGVGRSVVNGPSEISLHVWKAGMGVSLLSQDLPPAFSGIVTWMCVRVQAQPSPSQAGACIGAGSGLAWELCAKLLSDL